MAPQPHLQNQRPMVDGENEKLGSLSGQVEDLHPFAARLSYSTVSVMAWKKQHHLFTANIANIYEQPLKSHPTLRHKWRQ